MSLKTGWCIDGHHRFCPHVYGSWIDITCPCECHSKEAD